MTKQESKKSPRVDFALSYGSPWSGFLSASAARLRLSSLVEDARALAQVIAAARKDHASHFMPIFDAEIASYYRVGYVSCMEWHARSRFADLLSYKPESLEKDDLKNRIDEGILVEMLRSGAPFGYVLASGVMISSWPSYVGVFSRMLKAFGLGNDLYSDLKNPEKWTESAALVSSDFLSLADLYSSRHQLVHEINISLIGHPNVRDDWTFEDAVACGDLILRVFDRIESCLRETLPVDFPNLVSKEGCPLDRRMALFSRYQEHKEKVLGDIQSINKEYDADCEEHGQWVNAINDIEIGLQRLEGLVECSGVLHNRYLELKAPLRSELHRLRASLIQAIEKSLP